MHAYFWSLAALAFPEQRQAHLVEPLASPEHGVSLPPDEHLLCYDYLYYVCAHQVRFLLPSLGWSISNDALTQPFEFEYDFSPAWRYVAQYMHFTPRLEHLADEYVRRALGITDGDEDTPPVRNLSI